MHLKVTVTPRAKKESLKKISSGIFTLSVKAKAERNMANQRVRELLAEHFGVPVKKIRIVTGHRKAKKLISIEK